jgi:hypothetical protein
MTHKDVEENMRMHTRGYFVYSVTMVARPAKGLDTKLVIPIARPLIKIGNNN